MYPISWVNSIARALAVDLSHSRFTLWFGIHTIVSSMLSLQIDLYELGENFVGLCEDEVNALLFFS